MLFPSDNLIPSSAKCNEKLKWLSNVLQSRKKVFSKPISNCYNIIWSNVGRKRIPSIGCRGCRFSKIPLFWYLTLFLVLMSLYKFVSSQLKTVDGEVSPNVCGKLLKIIYNYLSGYGMSISFNMRRELHDEFVAIFFQQLINSIIDKLSLNAK